MSTSAVHVGQLQKANGGPQAAVLAQPQLPAPISETAATVLAAQAKAIVEARFVMAARNPRDFDVVRQRLLRECQRPGFADAAIYHKPVGKGIEDLSIRFAEAAIRCMTNIDVSTITVYDDREKRIVNVSVADLETTTSYAQNVTVQKSVERHKVKETDTVLGKRLNSKNELVYIIEATDDEILNKENALISKALRTLALRIVPGDIKDECKALCYKVLDNKAAKDPDAEKRNIFDSFATQGVSVDQVKDYLGHNAEQLTPKELRLLRGLYVALRDGETTWREIMDAGKPEDKEPPAKPPLDQFQQQGQQAAAQQQQQQQTSAQPEQKQASGDDAAAGKPTVEEIIVSINSAKTVEAIDKVVALIEEVPEQDKHAMLHNIANNKRNRLIERTSTPAQKVSEQPDPTPSGSQRPRTRSRTLD